MHRSPEERRRKTEGKRSAYKSNSYINELILRKNLQLVQVACRIINGFILDAWG